MFKHSGFVDQGSGLGVLGFRHAEDMPFPKGPCTYIVYTLATKYPYSNPFGPKMYTI